MAYADYAFYKDTYHGAAISEDVFAALSERASDYIDYITRDKAKADDPKVKKACCALAENYQIIAKAKVEAIAGEKESEKVGSWSVSYRSSAEQVGTAEKGLYSIAVRYLSAYMYRGGDCSCICRTP